MLSIQEVNKFEALCAEPHPWLWGTSRQGRQGLFLKGPAALSFLPQAGAGENRGKSTFLPSEEVC